MKSKYVLSTKYVIQVVFMIDFLIKHETRENSDSLLDVVAFETIVRRETFIEKLNIKSANFLCRNILKVYGSYIL